MKGVVFSPPADNMVFKGTYYKADSNIKVLHYLVLRMHKDHALGNIVLHVVHILGTRMEKYGVDGLFGWDPLTYLPLYKR